MTTEKLKQDLFQARESIENAKHMLIISDAFVFYLSRMAEELPEAHLKEVENAYHYATQEKLKF